MSEGWEGWEGWELWEWWGASRVGRVWNSSRTPEGGLAGKGMGVVRTGRNFEGETRRGWEKLGGSGETRRD